MIGRQLLPRQLRSISKIRGLLPKLNSTGTIPNDLIYPHPSMPGSPSSCLLKAPQLKFVLLIILSSRKLEN